MKKRIVFFLLSALILALILFVSFFLLNTNKPLSSDQEQAVKMFGHPYQFIISYIPTGDVGSNTLSRFEVWYYPQHKLKITFTAGETFNIEDLENEDFEKDDLLMSRTNLKPEDFYFNISLVEIKDLLGKENVQELQLFPDMEIEDDFMTYFSDQAFFIYEKGSLSFFQTTGVLDNETK